MTKKLIIILLTILLVFMMTVPAFAAGDADDEQTVQAEDVYEIYFDALNGSYALLNGTRLDDAQFVQTEDSFTYSYLETSYTISLSRDTPYNTKKEVADEVIACTEELCKILLDQLSGPFTISCDTKEEVSVDPLTDIKTFSHDKIVTIVDPDGVLQCKYVLTATFSYIEGMGCVCTDVSYTQTIYGSGWTFSNGSATADGAWAGGKGTFTKRSLFGITKDYVIDISMTSDVYGVVS